MAKLSSSSSSNNLQTNDLKLLNYRDHPRRILWNKIENIIYCMKKKQTGVPIKTVKSILTKIPDVFSGEDMVLWLVENLHMNEQEAVHLGSLIAAHGYFFPIDDHVIMLKNDGSFYRFQNEHYWPSKGWEPDNTEYAVYLCKRTMQNKARLELADYEAENLAKLQMRFSKGWDQIYSRAEQEANKDRKREKVRRKVLDSQERAFWDVHRPVPACVNTTEVDIMKAYYNDQKQRKTFYNSSPRKNTISTSESSLSIEMTKLNVNNDANISSESVLLLKEIEKIKKKLNRHCLKMSKACGILQHYIKQHCVFDSLLTQAEACHSISNPWHQDDHRWVSSDNELNRIQQWKFSFGNLLKDRTGTEEFRKFLQKEFSAENLDFWLACKRLKSRPINEVKRVVKEIYSEYLDETSSTTNMINIDSRVKENVETKIKKDSSDRYCFDDAQEHIYNLMKSDSYARFIKSDQYNSAKSASTASKRQSDNSTSLNNQIFNTKQSARLSSTQESGRYLALVNDPQCE